MSKPFRLSISNKHNSCRDVRYGNYLTSSGSFKNSSFFISQKYSLCVGYWLYFPEKENGRKCPARYRYLLDFFISPYYLLAIFPRKCTDNWLLCHVYAVALFFSLYGEYVVRFFPFLGGVFSTLFLGRLNFSHQLIREFNQFNQSNNTASCPTKTVSCPKYFWLEPLPNHRGNLQKCTKRQLLIDVTC